MEVRALERREVRRALPAMVRAFWAYPESVHLLPEASSRRRALPRYLASDMFDSASFGLLLGAMSGTQIIGAAAWLGPTDYPVSTSRQIRQVFQLLPAVPWALGAAREARQGQSTNRWHHRGQPPHFYLRTIGIDPDCQGAGVGSALILPVLARADREGVGCFLTTATAANAAWYERLGFSAAAEYRPTPTWPKVWAMWREPRQGC